MKRLAIVIAAVGFAMLPRVAWAQLQELRQNILGMD
jgi:hypothetical protein